MALRCGIIGLPNVGKSTLFTALTSAKAAIANYPFTTIDPNVGVVEVPDQRLQHLAEIEVYNWAISESYSACEPIQYQMTVSFCFLPTARHPIATRTE